MRSRVLATFLLSGTAGISPASGDRIDFNREIRPLLSNHCVACHGPDEKKREAGLRLDTPEGAFADLGGYAAVVPGKPGESEILERLLSEDPDEVMPPPEKGKRFTPGQVDLIRRWIAEGAAYKRHWSYLPPEKGEVPAVSVADWPANEIDRFLLDRMEREGLAPLAEADRRTLARRLSLDLTGLPPSWEEVEAFANDSSAEAYGRFVAALLAKPAFGEHWAQSWLDLARYADSSGYPSDQPREIWGYRDWVIAALNRNLPFDRFTIEQIAGDLLPDPTGDQLIATAFHRNTMTQNEGGTSDEEFRVAAVVDRVNTTMAVWMGTTMACAQCHTHKYDPITQHEYFSVYAILNQSADADRKDETPVHAFFTADQKSKRRVLETEIKQLEERFAHPHPGDFTGLDAWQKGLVVDKVWQRPKPLSVSSLAGAAVAVGDDGRVSVAASASPQDTLSIRIPLDPGQVEALCLEALADPALPGKGPGHAGGNFVVTGVRADFVPDDSAPVTARRLRITKPSQRYDFLALAEVQVFSGTENIARKGRAEQISTNPDGPTAALAIDGGIAGDAAKDKSVAVTGGGTEPQWWEVTFDADRPIDRVVIWKRTDKGQGTGIDALDLELFDASGKSVWSQSVQKTFGHREEITVSGRREIRIVSAFADATQNDFDPLRVLDETPADNNGWAIAGHTGADHALTLLTAAGSKTDRPGSLEVTIAQQSRWDKHVLGSLRMGFSRDAKVRELEGIPATVLSVLAKAPGMRSPEDTEIVKDHYLREVAAGLKTERTRLAAVKRELEAIKPSTVPIMQELAEKDRRETRVQLRGNWQNLGDVVGPGVPAAFHPLPEGAPRNRLGLAQWLVSRNNPLTARVVVNRYWEAIFGTGIVATSEEFGSQGEPPVHPELLDWLAVDFMEHGWDVKRLLTQLVTSRAYRQVSGVTPELRERDPDNRLVARGPRFRPGGELLRDQALAVGGLLSPKMGGPGVRPMAPNLGLTTAFGRSNDWTTSPGEDRHRRSVYTEARRNGTYASFVTFDAPNREVCTIRRGRTNTPLQAFVTMNDPVFVEAAQALARRLGAEVKVDEPAARVRHAFRLALSRDADESEVATLTRLHSEALAVFRQDPAAAEKMAVEPIGAAPEGSDLAGLAAWTATANVILNLDEFLMRP